MLLLWCALREEVLCRRIPLLTRDEVPKRIPERWIWVSRSNFDETDNGRNSSLKEFPTTRDDFNFFLNNSILCGDGVLT